MVVSLLLFFLVVAAVDTTQQLTADTVGVVRRGHVVNMDRQVVNVAEDYERDVK